MRWVEPVVMRRWRARLTLAASLLGAGMRGRAIRLLSALAEQGQAIAPRQAGKRARRVVAYNIRGECHAGDTLT